MRNSGSGNEVPFDGAGHRSVWYGPSLTFSAFPRLSNMLLRSRGSFTLARATMGEEMYWEMSGELVTDATCSRSKGK